MNPNLIIKYRAVILALICILPVIILPANADAAVSKAAVEQQFQVWLKKDMRVEAEKAGIPRFVYLRATGKLKLDWALPDLAMPGIKVKSSPQKQAEFRAPAHYFSEKSIKVLVQRGRGRLKQWKRSLDAIEMRYGVPRRIIVAIWGRESGFGQVKMPKNAIRSLATQAFMGRRKGLFKKELLAALKIVASGDVVANEMGSSWAGALGQPQFLPSKFHQYAVDFDGDGRRDIWNSTPDALASIANYLKLHGWRRGRDWGFEASIPDTISCSLGGPDTRQTISQWSKSGVSRISGRAFPVHEKTKRGFLLFPAGRFGPVFVTTSNFYVLKQYNESDVYALFVGHLADRMANNMPFRIKWKKLDTLSRGAVRKMQKSLIAGGYDVGGADGFIGYKTRSAIGLWQRANSRRETCFPDRALVKAIHQGLL